jgi:hypothetical protein
LAESGIGEIERMDERPSDIGDRVAGERTEPGLHGVDGLHPAGKAKRADLASDQAGLVGDHGAVLAHQHDHRRIIAEGDEGAAGFAESALGLLRHQHRVLIDGAALRPKDLAPEAALQLGPFAPVAGQFADSIGQIEGDEAGREAIGDRHIVEDREHQREALMRETLDGEASNETLTDPGRIAGPELAAADHGVEIHRARRARQ